jgi:hypothetical protein
MVHLRGHDAPYVDSFAAGVQGFQEGDGMSSADRERLPVRLAEAARTLLLSDDGSGDRERDLLQAFGPLQVGSLSHRRAVCLCLNAVRRVLARWGVPTCGPTAALMPAVDRVWRWVEKADEPEPEPSDWESFCHLGEPPPEAGTRTEATDYASAVFAAVSALARFTLFAGVWDGVEALANSSLADCEEARSQHMEMPFWDWLAGTAVAAAHERRRLSPPELNPGCQTTPRLLL